jgi:release factor glutamine methyltransferase
VYAPQHDSYLLIEAARPEAVTARSVLDVCTGSGVVAIAMATAGTANTAVSAHDISGRAVACARANVAAAGVHVDVHHGSLPQALARGPYDLVVANPPYVPTPEHTVGEPIPAQAGPASAYDGGRDGRLVLDPLCRAAPRLLTRGGTLLLVQSEFSGIDKTLNALAAAGMTATVMSTRSVPFGPVLTARARWLERIGMLIPGRREETLVVIKATAS